MARFYRTASAAPMDYMYQMNIPLMQQVLSANEAGVNAQIQQAGAIGDLSNKFNYLNVDAERARQISQDYSSQVDSISKAIQQDPMQWRKQKGALKDLARNLEQNYRVGEISKISGNYAKYKELDDYITKREEAGKLTPVEGAAFRAKALESLKEGTGYNPQTGQYKMISTTKPMDTINVRERLAKFIDDMKANEGLEWDTQAGQYFKKTTRGREYISPERIIETAMSGLMGDTELQQYLRQRSDFGLMRGVFGEDGKFIAPYNYVANPASDVEKQQISALQSQIAATRKQNPQLADQMQGQLDNMMQTLAARQRLQGNKESSLFPVIASLAGEYSYDKTKQGVDLKNNSLYNLGVNNAFQAQQKGLDRAQRERFFDAKQGQAQKFHDDAMALGWYKALNPPTKGTGTGKAGAKKDAPPAKVTGAGMQAANPFFESKFYSNDGLSTTIDTNKGDINNLQNKINDYSNKINDIMRGRTMAQLSPQEAAEVKKFATPMQLLQDQVLTKSKELDLARDWYAKSTDWALNGANAGIPNMTNREKELYKMAENPAFMKRLNDEVQEARTRMVEERGSYTGPGMGSGSRAVWASPEDAQKSQLLEDIKKAKERGNELRNQYLTMAKQESNVKVPTIEFGDKDREEIGKLLRENNIGKEIFNATGSVDGGLGVMDSDGVSWFSPRADNRKLNFADNNLQEYLDMNNGEMEVLGVSPTMNFGGGGSGATMRVRFKSKAGSGKSVGEIPANKDFYVTLDPQTQITIGQRYINNTNPEVAQIGKMLLDSRDQAIRNQMLDVRVPQGTVTSGDQGVNRRVSIPLGEGKNLQVFVKDIYNGNGDWNYYVTLKKSDGTEVPMKSSSSAGNGWFDSIEQFIDQINKNFQAQTFE